jgi:uncharacterized damage-inducible protein DinB
MQQLLDYAHYNLWANKGLADLFRQQSDALLETPVVSSFPSVRDTFLHLWSVEDIWYQRLNGRAPGQFIASTFQGSNATIFDSLSDISQRLIDFIGAQEEAYFSRPLRFTLLTAPGVQEQLPKDMIHHLFNHQTMHRGQLITMGRQLGITAFPRTDYIIWLRGRQ